jgi:hypothetical protein
MTINVTAKERASIVRALKNEIRAWIQASQARSSDPRVREHPGFVAEADRKIDYFHALLKKVQGQ